MEFAKSHFAAFGLFLLIQRPHRGGASNLFLSRTQSEEEKVATLAGSLGSGAVCVLLAALLAVSNKSRDFEHAARRCDSWQAHKQLTHNVISENVFQGPPRATQKKRA